MTEDDISNDNFSDCVKDFLKYNTNPFHYEYLKTAIDFRLFDMDVRYICQKNKHLSDKCYNELFKMVFLTDKRISKIIAANDIYYRHDGIGISIFVDIVRDWTGMSAYKIRKHLESSPSITFVGDKYLPKNYNIIKPNVSKKDFNVYKKNIDLAKEEMAHMSMRIHNAVIANPDRYKYSDEDEDEDEDDFFKIDIVESEGDEYEI
jgi:hypothetical protein